MALRYFQSHKKYSEYRGSPKLQKIYDQEFMDLIKQRTIQKNLVGKSYMDKPQLPGSEVKWKYAPKEIKFKMEGVTTPKRL
jgi:hypothetical protein